MYSIISKYTGFINYFTNLRIGGRVQIKKFFGGGGGFSVSNLEDSDYI